MSIENYSLSKGERLSLEKEGKLTKITFRCGWDEVARGGTNVDIDASAFCLDSEGKLVEGGFCYFNNKSILNAAISLDKDDLTGSSSKGGDDETVNINLATIPANVAKILLCITVFDAVARKQTFGLVEKAFGRLVNEETGKEMVKLNLTEDYSINTGIKVLSLYRRDDGQWAVQAIAEGINGPKDAAGKEIGNALNELLSTLK